MDNARPRHASLVEGVVLKAPIAKTWSTKSGVHRSQAWRARSMVLGSLVLRDAKRATPRGFEPLRAEPNGFRVHLLNRSDTVSCATSVNLCYGNVRFCQHCARDLWHS